MERDELLKLKKDELADKIIELSTTEVGKAIAERDAAWEKQGEQATRITDLEVELGEKKSELEAALRSVEEVKAKLAEMDTDAEKEELSRQVNDLTERLAANVATKGDSRPVVKVQGKHYLFIAQRFRLPDGRTVKAEEAMRDQRMLEALVESGSAVLKEVPINA